MKSSAVSTWTQKTDSPPDRRHLLSMKRGMRGRCPCCGEGKLFRAFLKVNEICPSCGEELFHHRADDLPAYLVIVIVGHIVVPLALAIETRFSPSIMLQLAIYLPITFISSLLLLQPVKGTVVGLQWACRMHGFDDKSPDDMPVLDAAGGKTPPEIR